MQDQQAYWNKVANEKTFTHPIDFSLLNGLKKDAVIIDFGCGYGRLVKEFNDQGYTDVKGFDTSMELIRRGQKTGLNNIFHLNNIHELPVEPNSVDCVILFAVLTCIPDNHSQQELIELLYSRLKTGGMLYLSDYYVQHHSEEMDRYIYLNEDKKNFGVFNLREGATFRHHTKDWIAELTTNFNLEQEWTVEVETMNGHKADAFQMILRK